MNIRSISVAALGILAHGSILAQANAGPDTSLCVNSYTMQGSPLPPGANGVWAIVAGCGTIVNAGSPTTDLNSLCVGTNVFTWYVDDNGTITTDQMVITVYDASMAVANAGPDTITVIAPQSSAFLSGAPTPIYPATCWWSWVQGSGVVVDPNDPNTSAGGLTIGGNILLWTCDNGPCGTTSDTLVIQLMQTPTGIEDTSNGPSNPFVYNPGTRELHVLNGTTIKSVEVFDSRGQCIITTNVGTRTISMNDRPEGIYVARAIVDDRSVVQRFVVGH